MNQLTLIVIVVGIILLAIVLNIVQRRRNKRISEGKSKAKKTDEFPDLNEKFLENVSGKEVLDLVKVYNPQDKIILRSILDSEGIETYVKSNNFGDLYPTYDLNNFATTVISIYKDNSIIAKQVVENYLLTLKKESYTDDTNHEDDTAKTSSELGGNPPEFSKFIPELLI